jgi:hypothetical protein
MMKQIRQRLDRLEAEAGVAGEEPLEVQIHNGREGDEFRILETITIYPSGRQERIKHDQAD